MNKVNDRESGKKPERNGNKKEGYIQQRKNKNNKNRKKKRKRTEEEDIPVVKVKKGRIEKTNKEKYYT